MMAPLLPRCMLRRLIHPSAWRDCPKRGMSNTSSVDLAGIRRAKWTKTPSLVARKAMLKVRRRLFGQSLRETVRKASLASQPSHHQAAHRHVDERFATLGQPLVVLAHPPVVIYPGKRSLHYPAAK